ncbi:MAG: amidohydrolase [Planctomycetota bacterium]
MTVPATDPIGLRRALHRQPEVSGAERKTAATVARWLEQHARPSRLLTGLGGHGLAALFGTARPAVLLRAELDALPIQETPGSEPASEHASQHPGVMHACGHDGHAAILCALAARLAEDAPVALLFQPAEETGEGARAVLADPRWPEIRPSRWAFALHNLPGRPLGEVSIRPGPALCGSVGLRLDLAGRTAHAAHPEDGDSPARSMAELVRALPRDPEPGGPVAMTTLTHARLGEPTFGVSPGAAVFHVTCRAETEPLLDQEVGRVRALADDHGAEITEHERFAATINDDEAVEMIKSAASSAGLPVRDLDAPMRWSEDFGAILDDVRARGGSGGGGAMLMLGSGEHQPPLHDPSFDFPDDLIRPAAGLWLRLLDSV